MAQNSPRKSIHFASTVWFVMCAGFALFISLRQAGIRGWVLFSLSGYGILFTFFLVSLYLFAIFRGISSSNKLTIEHPLTSTFYYKLFYATTPFFGGFAGCLGMLGSNTMAQFEVGVSLGTLGMTFLVWVVVDPAVAMLEGLLSPAARKNRLERLEQAKIRAEEEKQEREQLLAEISIREEEHLRQWAEVLQPKAEQLAALLMSEDMDFTQAQREAVGIGAKAWQMGGISCMRILRDMALSISQQKSLNGEVVDYISSWWDGIGNWQAPFPA